MSIYEKYVREISFTRQICQKAAESLEPIMKNMVGFNLPPIVLSEIVEEYLNHYEELVICQIQINEKIYSSDQMNVIYNFSKENPWFIERCFEYFQLNMTASSEIVQSFMPPIFEKHKDLMEQEVEKLLLAEDVEDAGPLKISE